MDISNWKKRFILILSAAWMVPAVLYAKIELAPYYSLEFTEGVSVPSQDTWFFSTNITNDLGLIAKVSQKHNLLSLYEIKYIGPGLERSEGREFSERAMDHILFIQDQYSLDENLILKTRFDLMQEFQRTGADEIWGEGLYDFNRYGGEIRMDGIDRLFTFWGMKINGALQYHFFSFPNYTDLLSEYQRGEVTAETAGGKQNYHLYSVIMELMKKESILTLQLEYQPFTKQKVLLADGTYSGKKQSDMSVILDIKDTLKASQRVLFSPGLNLLNKKSNQNYLYFKDEDTTTFLADYYDYTEIALSAGMTLDSGKKREFFLIPELTSRFYHHRSPRDAAGDFQLDEKQKDTILNITLGTTVNWNEVSRFSVFYSYHSQSSNMKYEKYLPYNYSGHYFGTSLSFSY